MNIQTKRLSTEMISGSSQPNDTNVFNARDVSVSVENSAPKAVLTQIAPEHEPVVLQTRLCVEPIITKEMLACQREFMFCAAEFGTAILKLEATMHRTAKAILTQKAAEEAAAQAATQPAVVDNSYSSQFWGAWSSVSTTVAAASNNVVATAASVSNNVAATVSERVGNTVAAVSDTVSAYMPAKN